MIYDVQSFLKYLNIQTTRSGDVQVICYDEHENVRLASKPVEIDFYFLSVKKNVDMEVFEDKVSDYFLYSESPGNILQWDMSKPPSGFCILVEAKLLNKTATYNFLSYNNHEALFLTCEEKEILIDLFAKAYVEFSKENYPKEVLLSYASLILSYADIYYKRQFESRSKLYNKVVADFYQHLKSYFTENTTVRELPSVTYFAQKANLSINYFGDLIKHFTGSSPIDHIHQHLTHIAKEKLLKTNLSVSEIAYSLGFEYPNYFAKFFRQKTGISPSAFRNK